MKVDTAVYAVVAVDEVPVEETELAASAAALTTTALTLDS